MKMYTVKTVRSVSGDAPQVSIDYQDTVTATACGRVTSTSDHGHLDVYRAATIPSGDPTAQDNTTDASYVSLLPNITTVHRLEGCQEREFMDSSQGREPMSGIQGKESSASVVTYDNVTYALSANPQTGVNADDVPVDSSILTFDNMPYCSTQNPDTNPNMQRFVILPLSQPSDMDNTDNNGELQTAVANIRSPVYSEHQDSVYAVQTDLPSVQTVHVDLQPDRNFKETPEGGAAVINNVKMDTEHNQCQANQPKTITQVKQIQASKLQRFTRSDLSHLGTSEKEFITDFLENPKGSRRRHSNNQKLDSCESKTEGVLPVDNKPTCTYKIEDSSESVRTAHSQGSLDDSAENCIHENTMDQLDSDCVDKRSNRTIRGKTVSNTSTSTQVGVEKSAKAGRPRRVSCVQNLKDSKDQNKKQVSLDKRPKRKLRPTRKAAVTNCADSSGPDVESRFSDQFFSRSFHENKCIIALSPLNIRSFNDNCTEYIIEVEIASGLDVSQLSKSELSYGSNKVSFSVTKSEYFKNRDTTNHVISSTESDHNVHVQQSQRNVRKRKSGLLMDLGRKAKSAVANTCDSSVVAVQSMSDDVKVSDVKHEHSAREVKGDNDDSHDEIVSDYPEVGDSEMKTITKCSSDQEQNVCIEDPLSLVTASLNLDKDSDSLQGKIVDEKLNPETLVNTLNSDSDMQEQMDSQTLEDENVTDKMKYVPKKKKERNYITRIGEDGCKVYGCPHCSHTSKYSQNMLRHIAEHSGERNFVCEECGYQFKSKNRLSKHMVIHQTDRPYICPLCPNAFKSKKIFCCTICPHETKKSQNMSVHMNQHTNDRPYQCEVCGQTFNGPSNLRAHKSQHSDILKYKCSHCNKEFRDRATYRQHTRRHMGDKRHTCEHCGKSFVVSTDLKKHIRVHTGEKPYQCGVCGKAFSDGSGMMRHQRIHTAKSRFECGACYKLFTRKDLCNYHIKKLHSDLGPVKVREINLNEISASTDTHNIMAQTRNETGENNLQINKVSPPKKTWQDFERLTEEATRRLQGSAVVQGYVAGPVAQMGEFQYSGMVSPIQHFQTLSAPGREYSNHGNYYQPPNMDLTLYTQEPIQNL